MTQHNPPNANRHAHCHSAAVRTFLLLVAANAVACSATPPSSSPHVLIKFVANAYTKPDPLRGRISTARFREVGAASFTPGGCRNDDKTKQLLEQETSRRLGTPVDHLCVEEQLKDESRSFLTFSAVAVAVTGDRASPERAARDAVSLSAVAFLDSGHLIDVFVVKQGENPEVSGDERQLWDIFRVDAQEYLLVRNRRFESDNFEVFQVTDRQLHLITQFEFGGL